MDSRKYFETKWLSADDLPDGTDRLPALIEKVTEEKVMNNRGEERAKLCLWFKEIKKGKLVSKQDYKNLRRKHGPETEDWEGKEVTLSKFFRNYFGGMYVLEVVA